MLNNSFNALAAYLKEKEIVIIIYLFLVMKTFICIVILLFICYIIIVILLFVISHQWHITKENLYLGKSEKIYLRNLSIHI